jgi:hypothetical protein
MVVGTRRLAATRKDEEEDLEVNIVRFISNYNRGQNLKIANAKYALFYITYIYGVFSDSTND